MLIEMYVYIYIEYILYSIKKFNKKCKFYYMKWDIEYHLILFRIVQHFIIDIASVFSNIET